MRFTLMDPSTKKTLIFTVTPEELEVTQGARTVNYSHVMIGDSEVPRGTVPVTFSFSGILPSENINIPRLESNASANTVINQIKTWQKADRKKLKLIITKTPWNIDVFIQDFTTSYSGNLITFSITLKEFRSMVVPHTKQKVVKRPAPKKQPAKKARVYTVKKGDNLWNIAKKYTGKGIRWKEMWAINKSKSRSKNPHLIYPGEKFTLPSGW